MKLFVAILKLLNILQMKKETIFLILLLDIEFFFYFYVSSYRYR